MRVRVHVRVDVIVITIRHTRVLVPVQVYEHECGEAVEKFGIRGFPTFKFFKGGKQVDEIVGADVDGLRRLLNKHK